MNKKMAAIFSQSQNSASSEDGRNSDGTEAPQAPMAGNWSRITYRETKNSLNALREGLYAGVVAGQVPVVLSPDQIVDEIGSDRVAPEVEDPQDPGSLSSLKDNIQKRGQRTPIRVRPADPTWRPNEKAPQEVEGAQFLLLSGRRRLQVCRDINSDVIALIDFSGSDDPVVARLEDLQERYFENVSRRDLNSFEKLASIGLMAQAIGEDKTHQEIAELLHTSRSRVTKGLKVVEFYDEILEMIDPATATYEQINQATAACAQKQEVGVHSEASAKDAENTNLTEDVLEADLETASETHTPIETDSGQQEEIEQIETADLNEPEPFRRKKIGNARLSLSKNAKGISTLKIYAEKLDRDVLAKIEEILAQAAD
jgi:ParB/RepB/Spo0J family partition protein